MGRSRHRHHSNGHPNGHGHGQRQGHQGNASSSSPAPSGDAQPAIPSGIESPSADTLHETTESTSAVAIAVDSTEVHEQIEFLTERTGLTREELLAGLAEQLPIKRVMQPADVAALAIHLMVNTAITGLTINIDGGQQLIAGL